MLVVLVPSLLILMLLAASCPAVAGETSPWAAWPAMRERGGEVLVWNRAYRPGPTGLPERMRSGGRQMLASPVRLDISCGGKPLRLRPVTALKLVTKPESVTYSAESRGGGVDVTVRALIEPDGMWRVDVEIAPNAEVDLTSLRLVIPVTREHSRLLHWFPIPRNWPRVTFPESWIHPNSGARPKIWQSPFTPCVWIGDEDGGLEWFAETDEKWRPADADRALTIAEAGGAAELTAHIIEQPTRLRKPLKFTFGLQAGPVKPRPAHLRQGRFGYTHWGVFGMETKVREGTSPPVTQLDYLKGLGARFAGMHEDWTDYQGQPRVMDPGKMKSLASACHERGMGLVLYHSLVVPNILPGFEALSKDCLTEPEGANYIHAREPTQYDYPACHASRFASEWCAGIEELFEEYEIDGLYLDGAASPIPCANTKHGCGYRDASGNLRPTYPIFATRETMKRLRAICDARKRPALIVAHMSTMLTLPTLSFADLLLTGEQYWKAPDDFRPPLEFFRTESMGHNHGLPTDFIGYAPLGGEYARTIIALHNAPSSWCPGGTDMWKLYDRFDVDGARWVGYWSKEPLATTGQDNVLVSGFVHKSGRALLAVGNLNREPRRVTLSLAASVKGLRQAMDPLTQEKLDVESAKVDLELGAEQVRWIWLEPAPPRTGP